MQISGYSIELKDIHLYAHHGVLEQEREIGAWFTINLELASGNFSCTEDDEISGTVSYADVYEIVCNEMKKPSRLLEHVCQRICTGIYDSFKDIQTIRITLSKDTPPMGGDRLSAAVTLTTKR